MESSCKKLPLENTGAFSQLFLDYIQGNANLAPFYNQFPKIEGFKTLIEGKQFDQFNRDILVQELSSQYKNLPNQPNFSILSESNTFTVTTGHQLNIFTGPLYIVFKIVTIINLAKQLKIAYPDYNFVPIYWMATEDHDLEEIQHMRAFGEKHFWQTDQKGAVGRMQTDGLAEIAQTLGVAAEVFTKAYTNADNLADAVRKYMHTLFGEYGLITLDADSRAFKSEFASIISDDLKQHTAFELVNSRTKEIENLGYKTQISPREINFFYLENGIRERIVKEDDVYKVLNTNLSFSENEIDLLIENEPEKFSPNVVLRPLYEEVILPNLAYIGGPSEVPYWLQLKSVFDHYQVAFPALMPRNFALLLSNNEENLCAKLGIPIDSIFKSTVDLQKEWLKENAENSLELNQQLEKLKAVYAEIELKAQKIDQTLTRTAAAFETKSIDLIERMEKKLIRAEKRKHQEAMQKIEQLKEILFPGGGLQERKENIIPFLENRPDLIDVLLASFDPLEYKFNILAI